MRTYFDDKNEKDELPIYNANYYNLTYTAMIYCLICSFLFFCLNNLEIIGLIFLLLSFAMLLLLTYFKINMKKKILHQYKSNDSIVEYKENFINGVDGYLVTYIISNLNHTKDCYIEKNCEKIRLSNGINVFSFLYRMRRSHSNLDNSYNSMIAFILKYNESTNRKSDIDRLTEETENLINQKKRKIKPFSSRIMNLLIERTKTVEKIDDTDIHIILTKDLPKRKYMHVNSKYSDTFSHVVENENSKVIYEEINKICSNFLAKIKYKSILIIDNNRIYLGIDSARFSKLVGLPSSKNEIKNDMDTTIREISLFLNLLKNIISQNMDE